MGLMAPWVWIRPQHMDKPGVEQDKGLEVSMRYLRAVSVPGHAGKWFQDPSRRETLLEDFVFTLPEAMT